MATARGLCWTREGAAAADHMTVATLLPEEEDEEDGVEGGVAICCCWCGVFTTCVVTRVRGIVSQSDMFLRCVNVRGRYHLRDGSMSEETSCCYIWVVSRSDRMICLKRKKVAVLRRRQMK